MENINYIYFQVYCQQCGFEKSDHETAFQTQCNVKKFSCEHFDTILIKSYDKIFRLKVIFMCKNCSKIKNIDTNLGKMYPNGSLVTNDQASFNCCNKRIQAILNLTQNEQNNMQNNNINMINNNVNINNVGNNINYNNIINNNEDENNNDNFEEIFRREKKEIEKKNIIDFNLKNKILYFLDDKSKKSYKIYSKDDMILKYVLEDLENQFPELNVKNRRLKIGNNEINPDRQINSYSINASNIIVMQ